MSRRIEIVLILAAMAGFLMSCGRSAGDEPGSVVVIVMDAVRPDHLGCYGYARPTSANIDTLASGATLYERAVASASWTVPSHASLFTGKDPFQHGAHRTKPDGEDRFDNIAPLTGDNVTLASVFSAEGYTTAAFIANAGYMDARWGLDQGFDTYHTELVDSDTLNARIVDWLASKPDGPFFLFVNYMDGHVPYNTRPRPGVTENPVSHSRDLHRQLRKMALPVWGGVPQKLKQMVVDQYDTAIANIDEQIGLLFAKFKEAGYYDDMTIVVTSDHGESFGEHAMVGHGLDVFQAEIRIPLIIKSPGGKTAIRNSELVSISDVPSMILDVVRGIPTKKYAHEFANKPGNHPVIAENYFSTPENTSRPVYGDRLRHVRTAIFDWPYKYIHSTDGFDGLYDLEADPDEENNLIELEPETARRLEKHLTDYQDERGRANPVADIDPLTEDQIKTLKSLGYIGN